MVGLREAVDDLFPIQSGRNYRLQYKCKSFYYEDYLQMVEDPVSYSTFCKYLRTLKIWRVKATQCPHCEVLRGLENPEISRILTNDQIKLRDKKKEHLEVASMFYFIIYNLTNLILQRFKKLCI